MKNKSLFRVFPDGEPTANTTVTNPSLSSLPYEGKVGIGAFPTVDRRSNYTSSNRRGAISLGFLDSLNQRSGLFSRNIRSNWTSAAFRRVACILFVLFFSIGQMWGATTYDMQLSSSKTIAGKRIAEINGAYVARCGNSLTVDNKGIATNNSKIFIAFTVSSASTISVWMYSDASSDRTSKSIQSKTITDANWTTLMGALTSDLSSTNMANCFTALESKAIPYNGKSADWKGKEFKVDFTASAAGHYAIYLDNSIASDLYIHRVVVTPSGYSITFDCDGAEVGCPATNPATGQTALPSPLPTLTKTGYTFDKWYTNSGKTTPAVAGATLSADANLYANFNVQTYKISYKDEGNDEYSGSNIDALPKNHTYGQTTSLVDGAKDGYTFVGWYKEAACSNKIESVGETDYTADFTLYAKWIDASKTYYTVTYYDGEDELGNEQVEENNHPTASGINTDKEHFTFNGWKVNGEGDAKAVTDITITDHTSLVGDWTEDSKYTVSFVTGCGATEVEDVEVYENETVARPTDPTRTNWEVTKWQLDGADYNFDSPVTSDIELTAVWQRKTISGTSEDFTLIDGTSVKSVLSSEWKYSAKTANNHVKFAGGMNGSSDSRFITFVIPEGKTGKVKNATIHSSNIFVIIPESQVTEATRTFDYSNPYFSLTGSGKTEKDATVNNDMPAGKYYCGSTNSSLEISKLVITVSTSPITATFKDGESPVATVSATANEALGNLFLDCELPVLESHDGLTFLDWYDGENPVTKATTISASTTYTAKWQGEEHTLTWTIGEGATITTPGTPAGQVEAGTSLTAPVVERDGYRFDGWNPEVPAVMPNADAEYVAQWVKVYTVTYMDGENELGSETVDEGQKAIKYTQYQSQTLKDFKGWFDAATEGNTIDFTTKTIDADLIAYGKWDKAYAQTANFVEAATGTKPDISTFLSGLNYAISSMDNVSWDAQPTAQADQGLKIEKSGTTLSFWVEADKRVKIKVGTLEGVDNGTAGVSVDGGANYETIYGANPQGSGEPREYTYITTEETQFVVKINNGCPGTGGVYQWNLIQTITIEDKPAVSDDASLKNLTVNGEQIEGFARTKTTYNVVLPYKTTEAVVAAEANDEKATVGDISQATSLPGTASFIVTAEDGTTTADYTVNFTVAPKDGVSIIKAVAGGTTTIGTVTGALAGSAKINTSGSYKMDTKKYFMVALADNQKFQAGDIVEINVCSVNDGNGFTLYTKMNGDDFSSSDLIIDTHENSTSKSKVNLGINRIVLPESYAGSNAIYVGRAGSGDKYLNAGVNQVEVFRPMNPMLTKVTILDKEATIDETAKTVTVEVPYSTDITAVTPTFEFVSNDNSKVVITPAGAQDFTEAKTYRLTDKDGDYTEYEVSITKAAASSDATLNALSVDGYSLAPEFAAETTEYTVERAYADRDADLPTINYTLNHSAASAVKSAEGKVVTITVTAEDGTQKAYTITFTNKAASTDATLSSLKYGETDITLVDEQFEYDVTLPYGTTVVPALTAVKNDPLANDPVIANAPEFVDYEATSTVTVTAESGDEKVYTVNFSVEKFPTITIFDGSTMTNLATSPDATTGLSWGTTGTSMSQADKPIKYGGIDYPKSIQLGTTSATKYFTITVPENYQAQIRLLIMTNNSSSTRSAWITTSANKGDKEDAIMSVTSTSYSDLGDGTTDWLDEGTYYVHTDNTINFYIISAKMKEIAPKPVINGISDGTYCEGGDMPTLTVSATVSKGTMHYQWYKGSDAVGTDDASYTPSEDGTYYVVITNKVDGLDDATAQSENVVVESVAGTYITSTTGARDKAGEQVTISVTATGKNLIYAWYACDEIGTISGGKLGEAATLEVTVGENDTYYIVKVNGDCGTEQSEIVKVETWRETTQTLVTESAVWNLNTTDMAEAQVKPTKNVETLLANLYGIKNNDTFHADALLFSGEYLYRDGQTPARPSCGNYFKFTTTVPGMVTVTFSDNGTNGRHIDINGQESEASSNISDVKTFSAIVEAGEVIIKGENAGASDMAYVRFYKIEFTAATKIRSGLTNGKLVTMCQAQPIAKMWGGAAFDVEKKYSVGIELIEAELPLVAGKPYIVLAEAPEVYVLYAEGDAAEAPVSVEEANGLVGRLNTATTNLMLPDGEDTYIFSNNHLCSASGSNGNFAAPDRAYLNYGKVTDQTVVNAAPSRRRISMGGASADTPTALDAIMAGKNIRKMIINNQLVIIRDGHFFNAQGAKMR